MHDPKVIIALLDSDLETEVRAIVSAKLKHKNYNIFCIGSDFNLMEAMTFEPDYIVSDDYQFYKVNEQVNTLKSA